MEITEKRLVIFGGGNIGRELRRYADANYVSIVSVGNNAKLRLREYADEFYLADCTNEAQMISFLREKKIDAIFSCSSEAVNRKAIDYINRTGYRFYSTPYQWNTLMNKKNFKETIRQFGIAVIPEFRVNKRTGAPLEPVQYPVIVKPADNGGSFGISVCNNDEELTRAVLFALENSTCGSVLCERFMNGPYFQFEIWLQDGKTYLPYTKGRTFYPAIDQCPPQPFVDLYPSDYAQLIREQLFDKLTQVFKFLGVENGSCMFQGIIEDGVAYIMDTAFRLSGGMDYRVVENATGVDLIGSHAMYALEGKFGEDFSALEESHWERYATICIGISNGKIGRIEGLESVQALPYVYGLYQYYQIGDEMKDTGVFLQTFCRVFLKGNDMEELTEHIHEVMQMIHVYNTEGTSMLCSCPDVIKQE